VTRNIYQQRIAELYPDVEPRHVEAWMRLEFSTLDHLQFTVDLLAPYVAMARDFPRDSENLARSYGL
jgi:hypothetical protein